ncbi:MAG TPA: Gfo/Idh/MocA family oxidoreductase [Anaerolineae bacterium]|nr:Gfo/Idh/MocA family oxidoreductase [Anaerolineae bacterium]HIQ04880.1 Gfo/Idh/MocA family oxidoreductase [Anaerolineae bacterium]
MMMTMSNDTVRLGLISFEHMHAYSYARCLNQLAEAELVAIADRDAERLEQAARQFAVQAAYSDYHKLLEREDITAVIVCSANDEHAAITFAAAEAGKHVLCEKPLALSLDDGQRMIEVCRKNGLKLQVAFVCRYDPLYRQAKELVDAGEIGTIKVMVGTNRGRLPPGWFVDPARAGGGAVLDHSVHVVDLMRWFTGSEVQTVYAQAGTLLHPDLAVEDCGLLLLEFANGAIGSVDPSWSRPASFPFYGDMTMEVLGSEGAIYFNDNRPVLSVFRAEGRTPFHLESFATDADLEMIRHFVRCIVEDHPPLAGGEDGLKALEVALAAYTSAHTGQPVSLPLAMSGQDTVTLPRLSLTRVGE